MGFLLNNRVMNLNMVQTFPCGKPVATSVVVTANPMCMAMGDLFISGRANTDHFDIVCQCFAGQRMVGIDQYHFQARLHDRDLAHALIGLHDRNHAGFPIAYALGQTLQMFDRYPLLLPFLVLAVGLLGCQGQVQRITLNLLF